MRVGNVDPIPKSIELESVGGKVEINKVDSETKIIFHKETPRLVVQNMEYTT